MMRSLNYQIFLRKEPEGGYTIIVPALARARVTFGETVDEAREAAEVYSESLQERGEEVPTEEGCLEYRLTVEVPG